MTWSKLTGPSTSFSTNLCLSSQSFNVSPWQALSGAVVGSTLTVAPNGSITASVVTGTNLNSQIINSPIRFLTAGPKTTSAHLKYLSSHVVLLQLANLDTGVELAQMYVSLSASTASLFGKFNCTTSPIPAVDDNGFFRVSFSMATVAPIDRHYVTVTPAYSPGNSGDGVVLYGVQVEDDPNMHDYSVTTNVPTIPFHSGAWTELTVDS